MSLFSYCSISLLALTAQLSDNLLFPILHLQFFLEPISIKLSFLPLTEIATAKVVHC